MSKCKILVVDQETSSIETLRGMLSSIGEVEFCKTAEEGKEALKSKQFDWVISEIELPGKSGLLLYYDLLGLKDPPKIIFMNASNKNTGVGSWLKKLKIPYIKKPIKRKIIEKELLEGAQND